MYFDDEFLESLPEDIPSAITAICERYLKVIYLPLSDEEKHTIIKEAFGLLAAYNEAYKLDLRIPRGEGELEKDNLSANQLFEDLRNHFSQTIIQNEFDRYKNMYAAKLGKVFHYEISEGDLDLIQNLITKLRKLISTTDELGEDHRHRLIKKLEKVQSELHKRVSDLDRFWGFCIDLSIVVGSMGKNAEPAADLVKKIVAIIWPTQTRAYELPSSLPFKLLGQSEDDKPKDDKS
ncbi:MAG: hypothetical protein HQ580_03005 [Planctomycetes bacterium]|nr:hypothetical protein [Planctomycetota bacterium]